MSKIGPKELALKAQREQIVPPLKAVQRAKANMAAMKAPSPKDQLVVALSNGGDKKPPKFFGKKLTFRHVDEAVGIGSDSIPAKKAKPASTKCTIDHKADGAVPKELCATCNPDPKRKAPTPKKDNSSAGVTLAPPLAVQKAIAKDLSDDPMADVVKKHHGVAPDTKPEHPAKANPMESDMRSKTAKKAKKMNGHAKTAKPKKESKSEIVHRMLTTKHGATRDELHKVTGWPGGANLKVAAARAKMKLVEDKGGRFRLVGK